MRFLADERCDFSVVRALRASDAMTEVKIDLSQVMDGDYGHFIVVIAPPKALLGDNQEREWQTVRAWVQVTQIGIDAFYDQDDMVVWATALKDGTPLSGVTIEAGSGASQAITVEDGVARLPVPSGAAYLVASQGADKALLPKSTYYWGEDYWNTQPVTDELRWYVFDDRKMYRPGEEVHLKGWLRRIGGKQDGDVGLVGGEVSTVRYQVIDPVDNDLGGGTVEVNTLGGFDFIFKLPENATLGYTQLNLTAEGSLSKLTGLQ